MWLICPSDIRLEGVQRTHEPLGLRQRTDAIFLPFYRPVRSSCRLTNFTSQHCSTLRPPTAQHDARPQWRTQEFFFLGGGGSADSVEDRGQRERGSGGGSPPSQGLWRQV